MIRLESARGVFNHRVAGVALQRGHVLLHKTAREAFWSLPGGRVEMLEPAAASLEREMREELGLGVEVERLLWVVENFFRYEGAEVHELGFYFLMQLPDKAPLLDIERDHRGEEGGLELIFRWAPLERLASLRLYPSFLKTGLLALPQGPRHLVHYDV